MRGYEISKSKIHPVIRKPVFCLLYYPWLGSWWGFRFPIPSAIPVYFLIQSNEKCTGMISGFQQKCWAQHWKISGRDSRYFSESVPVGRLDYLKDGRRSMTKFKKEHQEQRAHIICLRLTDFELSILDDKAEKCRMTRSDFIRSLILSRKLTPKYEIVIDSEEIQALLAQYGKIESNLNQIAR